MYLADSFRFKQTPRQEKCSPMIINSLPPGISNK